ncbi:MAG TPA: outer membrane protein transport protein [Methylomirabilota bacterium]|nr:outer membrane protein transport protein [Methylomirabilota bacterium]
MNNKNKVLLASLAVGIGAAPQAHALGIRIADQAPKAIARGNAFAATADDPSAIYYNPAGITQLESLNALAGAYVVVIDSEYAAPDGSRMDTKDKTHVVPHAFYAWAPEDWPVAFGLGIYSPYGLGLQWPDNSTFREGEGSIRYATINPVVAWEVCPTFSIAGGFRYNHAKAELRQTIASRAIFPPGGEMRFIGDGADIGFNAGLLWKPHEQHSFGLTYFSATRIELEGDSSRSGADALGIPTMSERAEARFQFPQHVVAGYSFRPTKLWNFEVNVDWTDWDMLDTVTLQQASGNLGLAFNWQSSFMYEFGVTRYIGETWRVSAGYIFSENSVPESSFSPLVPDSDRHVWSAGVGGTHGQWAWDAAYQFAWGPSRDIANSTTAFPVGGTANGSYEFFSHALAVTVGYRF